MKKLAKKNLEVNKQWYYIARSGFATIGRSEDLNRRIRDNDSASLRDMKCIQAPYIIVKSRKRPVGRDMIQDLMKFLGEMDE